MAKIIGIIIVALGSLVLFVGLIIGLGLLFSWPVMLLWNGCLVGTVAGINPITSVWQAWGILILCALLFKSTFRSKKS